jgi:hypothetical protein
MSVYTFRQTALPPIATPRCGKILIASKADKEHPYFLDIDNIVIFGQVTGLTSIAWASESTFFVVSNSEFLHKWDLDELPNARIFEMPENGAVAVERKLSILGKIARLFGGGSGE